MGKSHNFSLDSKNGQVKLIFFHHHGGEGLAAKHFHQSLENPERSLYHSFIGNQSHSDHVIRLVKFSADAAQISAEPDDNLPYLLSFSFFGNIIFPPDLNYIEEDEHHSEINPIFLSLRTVILTI